MGIILYEYCSVVLFVRTSNYDTLCVQIVISTHHLVVRWVERYSSICYQSRVPMLSFSSHFRIAKI